MIVYAFIAPDQLCIYSERFNVIMVFKINRLKFKFAFGLWFVVVQHFQYATGTLKYSDSADNEISEESSVVNYQNQMSSAVPKISIKMTRNNLVIENL